MITKIEVFKESFGYSIPQVQPKDKDELIDIIWHTIKNSSKSYMCDLNFIDTSLITHMNGLFQYINEFNGDISKWNVSNVIDMTNMFFKSQFNGDISNWNVSKVNSMNSMFYGSQFNKDISDWNVSNTLYMNCMFMSSQFDQNIDKWVVSDKTDIGGIFNDSPLEKNPPSWYKN